MGGPVLVNYVVFDVHTDDRAAFDAWYRRLAEDAQGEQGCIAYDYLTDPAHPTRGAVVAAWESEEDIARHRLHPSHIELMALGSAKWGIRNIRRHSFADVGNYSASVRPALDDPAGPGANRDEMHRLISEYQRTPGASGERPGDGASRRAGSEMPLDFEDRS
jgi:quinol monooxygenase YgiN